MKITLPDGLAISVEVSGYIPLGQHEYNLKSRENLEKYFRLAQEENRRLHVELVKLRIKLKRLKK